MKSIIAVLLIVTQSPIGLFAQQSKELKITPVASGSVVMAVAGNAFYTSFGGPGVKLASKNWSAGLYMLPSLRFWKDKPRPLVTPVLGTGLLVGYKKFIMGVPLYYVASQLKWKTGIGIGVKFGK